MGKIITSLFVGLICAFFLIAPGFGLYLASKDSLAAMRYEGRETGLVTACRSKRMLPNNTAMTTAPVVQRENGNIIYGKVDEIRFLLPCKALIGDTVPLRYDIVRPHKVQIATFHQMWLQPLFVGLISFILYGFFGWIIIARR